VEQPAMVATANAAFLDLAVKQRRAAMHAARIDEARAAYAVAEQHEVLAENSYGAGQIGDLLGQRNWVPVAPQQFAHRLARPDLGPQRIRFVSRPAVSAAVGAVVARMNKFIHGGFLVRRALRWR